MKTKNIVPVIGWGIVIALWGYIVYNDHHINAAAAAKEDDKLIAECQAALPRNQKCVIVKKAIVEKDE